MDREDHLKSLSKDEIIKKYIFLHQENQLLKKQVRTHKADSGEKSLHQHVKPSEKGQLKKTQLFEVY